jgi:phenylpyruvate tautomerase PptA (4-oxalocrotonate tautomerase family)
MPFYTCTTVVGTLDADQKKELASQITAIHSRVTSAPQRYVRVTYQEELAGNVFRGGEIVSTLQISAHIRGGRCDIEKQKLAIKIGNAAVRVSKLDPENIEVLIDDIPARFIWASGCIAPEPWQDPVFPDSPVTNSPSPSSAP